MASDEKAFIFILIGVAVGTAAGFLMFIALKGIVF